MEAIAAFGLACNVIQVVDFGLKTASKCRQIYKEGATIEVQDLENTSKNLAEVSRDLDAAIRRAQAAKPLKKEDHELQDLSVKCSKIAGDLQVELQKLSSESKQSKRASLIKTFKTISRKGTIDDLYKRLSEYERVLNTRLLARLRYEAELFLIV